MLVKRQVIVFIVDEDEHFAITLASKINQDLQYNAIAFADVKSLLLSVELLPDVIILDCNSKLSEIESTSIYQLYNLVNDRKPDIPILLLTNSENISNALDLMKRGAMYYIVKNEETIEKVKKALQHLARHVETKEKIYILKRQIKIRNAFIILLGISLIISLFFILIKYIG